MAQNPQRKRRPSLTFKIWRPGTHLVSHHETLTLEGRKGLRFFLESLARGNTLFRNQLFEIAAYTRKREIVGHGVYRVQRKYIGKVPRCMVTIKNFMPVLQCHSSTGIIDMVLQEEWNVMSEDDRAVPEEISDYPRVYEGYVS